MTGTADILEARERAVREADLISRRETFIIRSIARIADRARAATNDAIRAAGFPDFSDAHAQVLFNLHVRGDRVTALAERAHISVQAMGKLVRDLEKKGYVERRPDPGDGRAQLVNLTARGVEFFEVAVEIIEAREREFEEVLGSAGFAKLGELTRQLAEHLDPDGF